MSLYIRGLLSVLALLAVETSQFSGVPSAHFGTFDFLELESAAYEVEIASTPVSELQLQKSAESEVRLCENSSPLINTHTLINYVDNSLSEGVGSHFLRCMYIILVSLFLWLFI